MRTLLQFTMAILGLVALLMASGVSAQAEVNLRIDQVDANAFPEVALFTTVTDSQGRFITGLSAESFVLREGDRNVVVQNVGMVAPEALALRVVLALDISKSIEPNLAQSKEAAIDFVRSLAPQDEIALVFFGNEARIVQPFSADHGAVINSILELGPDQLEDYTALYNGVFESIRLAADGASSGRRAVLLVTDGNNTIAPGSDSLTLADVQRSSRERRVPIHAIAVGADVSVQELRIIATDGQLLQVGQANELGSAYEEIAEQLRQQYLLRYTSQIPADNGTYPLELSVNIKDLGSSSSSTNVQALLPLIPQLRLTIPEELRVDQPAEIQVEIVSRNQPVRGELLIDGEVVVGEELSGSLWKPTWTPSTELTESDYTLEVRVTDQLGAIGRSSAQPIVILPDESTGIPVWVWIAGGAAALFATGLILFLLQRRTDQSSYQPTPQLAIPTLPSPSPLPPLVTTREPQPAQQAVAPTRPTDAPDLGQATLVVERGNATPSTLPLKASREQVIGRQPGVDLQISDDRASARHAMIRFREGGFVITDLNSKNGLWINGQRTERLRLQDGDQIEIGGVRIIFKQVRTKR